MSVVACPKCREQVTLPAKAPAAAKVRCPLCGENYLLSEAMHALPPVLEIVELPEGYREPEEEIDLSPASFAGSSSRPAPVMDSGDDLKLEGEGGTATATADEEPRHDQWGAVSSSTPAYELGEQVKRELQTKPRRKKKQVNPLVHVFGIVAGGLLAFPLAFLILLWLPGSLHRDPLNIGPWLGKNAPYLAPAKFRDSSQAGSESSNVAAAPEDVPVAKTTKRDIQPENPPAEQPAQVELGGSKFEDALKEAQATKGPRALPSPFSAAKPADDAPTLDDPLAPPPDPTTTEPTIELPTITPKPAETRKPVDDDPAEFKPAPPKVDPTDPAEDPLALSRAALTEADKNFNEATAPADKKAAAMAMYEAAAALAERLPEGGGESGLEFLVNDPMKLQVIGVYTSSWLDNSERASNGVVLSGQVKSCRAAGERFEMVVQLPTRDKREVMVIAPKEGQEGEQVFVAGRIVGNAKDMIGGYEGEAAEAIDARVVKVIGQ